MRNSNIGEVVVGGMGRMRIGVAWNPSIQEEKKLFLFSLLFSPFSLFLFLEEKKLFLSLFFLSLFSLFLFLSSPFLFLFFLKLAPLLRNTIGVRRDG